MQKIFINISRIVFGLGIMGVLLALFMVGMVSISNIKEQKKVVSKKAANDLAVLAMENSFSPDNSQDLIAEKVVADDARPLLIKRYLEKYKSPLLPYSDLILQLSDTYNLKYYWILAIAQQESNLCKKIPENSHNCWGYGINSAGTLKFESYEVALKSYAEYLKREYFDKGYDTPEKIMKKYCPHSNGSWAYGVTQFINEIETGTF